MRKQGTRRLVAPPGHSSDGPDLVDGRPLFHKESRDVRRRVERRPCAEGELFATRFASVAHDRLLAAFLKRRPDGPLRGLELQDFPFDPLDAQRARARAGDAV